ncbi:MAG: hypothetical protein JNL28_11620 [Planctomycetes bacterium]|nr:hypothetical protein [Planctomycetota bacterium]
MSARRTRELEHTAPLFADGSHTASRPPAHRIVAGIDEAGLGPMLGPLVIALCAFRVARAPLDLWEALGSVVAREPSRDASRLVVADSKVVFTRTPAGARRLEHTVLAFEAWRHGSTKPCTDTRAFLKDCALASNGSGLTREAWYASLPERLSPEFDADELAPTVMRLTDSAARAQVQPLATWVHAVPAPALNASFERTQNKSVTHWEASAQLLVELWSRHGHEGIDLVVDRHGGRMRYAALLRDTLPGSVVEIVSELPVRSEYVVTDESGRSMRIVFAERAESLSLPVALASCSAKYAREACMHAFNAYFLAFQPDLVPTAGYVTDARRWLAEANVAIARSGLARETIVRSR